VKMSPNEIIAMCQTADRSPDPVATAQQIHAAQLVYCRQNAQKPGMANTWLQVEQALKTLLQRSAGHQRRAVEKSISDVRELKRSMGNSQRTVASFGSLRMESAA